MLWRVRSSAWLAGCWWQRGNAACCGRKYVLHSPVVEGASSFELSNELVPLDYELQARPTASISYVM